MSFETPSGRARYRTINRWFRKPVVILEIEIESPFHTYWREARPEDLSCGPFSYEALA